MGEDVDKLINGIDSKSVHRGRGIINEIDRKE